jgi:iron transport multicopper oxidase
VHDLDSPFKDNYDEEIVLSFSDWYHDPMRKLLQSFLSVTNPTGAEPVPKSALINDSQNVTVAVQPGKTYMIRMVSVINSPVVDAEAKHFRLIWRLLLACTCGSRAAQ